MSSKIIILFQRNFSFFFSPEIFERVTSLIFGKALLLFLFFKMSGAKNESKGLYFFNFGEFSGLLLCND